MSSQHAGQMFVCFGKMSDRRVEVSIGHETERDFYWRHFQCDSQFLTAGSKKLILNLKMMSGFNDPMNIDGDEEEETTYQFQSFFAEADQVNALVSDYATITEISQLKKHTQKLQRIVWNS